MGSSISRTQRRIGMVINYAAVALIIIFAYVGEATAGNAAAIAGLILSVVVVLATLFIYHVRTGLWKLVHSRADNLDERQIQVTHWSLRYSYGIFTIIALLALLWKSVMPGHDPNLIIIFAVLLYLAHTLPSTIIAWTEKEI